MSEKALNNVKRWLNYVWDSILLNNLNFIKNEEEKNIFRKQLAVLALSVIHKESHGIPDLLNKKTKNKKLAAFGLTQQKPKFFSGRWGEEKYNPQHHILIYINTMVDFYKQNGSLLTCALCWASGEGAAKDWIKNGDKSFKEFDYLPRQLIYMKDLFLNKYPLYFDFVLSWLDEGRPTIDEIITSKKEIPDNFKNTYEVTLADYNIDVKIHKFFSPWQASGGVFSWRGVGERAIVGGEGTTRAGEPRARVSPWRGAAFLVIPLIGIGFYRWKQKIH